jgi:hypothetical protein
VTKIGLIRFSLRPPRPATPSHCFQIATPQQTKSSVTYSKQTIRRLPNRYKIGIRRCGEHRHPERATRAEGSLLLRVRGPQFSKTLIPNCCTGKNCRCGELRHLGPVTLACRPSFSKLLIATPGILIGTTVIRILPIYLKTRLENFSNRHSSRNSTLHSQRKIFSREPSNLLVRSTKQIRVCSPRQIDASNEVRLCVLSI